MLERLALLKIEAYRYEVVTEVYRLNVNVDYRGSTMLIALSLRKGAS